MLKTIPAVVRNGQIALLEPADLAEGTRALVTVLSEAGEGADDLDGFWLGASRSALDAVWDNPEDDVYADLLEE
jgi:hypothetical protein